MITIKHDFTYCKLGIATYAIAKESHSAFNISNQYFLIHKMCRNGWLSQIKSHMYVTVSGKTCHFTPDVIWKMPFLHVILFGKIPFFQFYLLYFVLEHFKT